MLKNEITPSFVNYFIIFRNSLHSEIRGGKKMYDIKGHYKWLDESELFNYYINN